MTELCRRLRSGRAAGVAVAVAVLAAAVSAWALGTWSVVASANPAGAGVLLSASADAAADAWAVGEFFNSSTRHYLTLAERWNGTAWSLTATKNPSSDEWLNGVAAVAPSNVWAVGFQNNSTWAANLTLIEHFSGNAWSTVTSPNPSSGFNELWGAYAASATDVWAVGDASTAGGERTLIEHWNGTSWTVIPSLDASSYDNLHRVFGSSSTDVWAVGTAYNASTSAAAPLVEHWNGVKWSIVPSPALGDSYLRGGWATSPSDAWIVGEWDGPAPTYTPHQLVYHWNGSGWTSVARPAGPGYQLDGVAAKSPTDA